VVSLFNLLAGLIDASGQDFTAREAEPVPSVRLTSSAWTGWYEEPLRESPKQP
jgi:hypothetical protein